MLPAEFWFILIKSQEKNNMSETATYLPISIGPYPTWLPRIKMTFPSSNRRSSPGGAARGCDGCSLLAAPLLSFCCQDHEYTREASWVMQLKAKV